MSEGERPDPDLERQLRAAFAAQRPRPGFAAELRARLSPSRPWWQRLLAPASAGRWVPALAAVLVAVGLVALLGRGLTGGHPASLSSTAGSQALAPGTVGSFGLLPAPVPAARAASGFAPMEVAAGPPGALTPAPFPTSAPVYRFRASDREVAAATSALSASSHLPVAAAPAAFAEPGFAVAVGEAAASEDRRLAAAAFLAAHGLQPNYPTAISIAGDVVVYQRLFRLPDGTQLSEVDGSGSPVGLRVIFSGAQLRSLAGPLDLPLETADYPLLTPDQARSRAATGLPPAAPRLVYVAVVPPGSAYGYFEPAYLFGGVLVAAIPTH